MQKDSSELFGSKNLLWMGLGVLLMLVGILLMSGGKSPDPALFNDQEVYSVRRITLAPILILAGLGVEVYAIMRK